MSRIIGVIIKNCLHQNKNREKVKNREIKYFSVFVLMQTILNYYPNYPTHRSYFGEVETRYCSENDFLVHKFFLCDFEFLRYGRF